MDTYFKIRNEITILEVRKSSLQKLTLEAKTLHARVKREHIQYQQLLKDYQKNYLSVYEDYYLQRLTTIEQDHSSTINTRNRLTDQIQKQTSFTSAKQLFKQWVRATAQHIKKASQYPTKQSLLKIMSNMEPSSPTSSLQSFKQEISQLKDLKSNSIDLEDCQNPQEYTQLQEAMQRIDNLKLEVRQVYTNIISTVESIEQIIRDSKQLEEKMIEVVANDYFEQKDQLDRQYKERFKENSERAKNLLDNIPYSSAFLACRSWHQIDRSKKRGGDPAKELRWKKKATAHWKQHLKELSSKKK